MTARTALHHTNDEIEQARARGWDAERTAETYGVEFGFVLDVWEAMDAALAQDDVAESVLRKARAVAGGPYCGTYAGYAQHRRRREARCEPCKAARSQHERSTAGPSKPRQPPAPCGTSAAYHRHWKAGELCEPCLKAHNERAKVSRLKNRDATNARRRQQAAIKRGMR